MTIVRTVLGDVRPQELGVTYMHEHLIAESTLIAERYPHIHLPSVEDASTEVRECAAAGVGAMVDAMPSASGRNVLKLAQVSRTTGVAVIATTGMHTTRYYDDRSWTKEEPADVLAELFRADVEQGIDRYDYTGPVVRRTPHRAGIVKTATLGERPDEMERKVFEAVAEAHAITGAPILTHCEEGRGGIAQLELLIRLRVPLERVLLSHTDKQPDVVYHRELLASGANLCYDQALRQPPEAQRGTAWLLATMLSEGFGDRLMLGTDGARRSLWRTLGGRPGLAWLRTGFVGVLDRWGIEQAAREALFVDNPARFLSFGP